MFVPNFTKLEYSAFGYNLLKNYLGIALTVLKSNSCKAVASNVISLSILDELLIKFQK